VVEQTQAAIEGQVAAIQAAETADAGGEGSLELGERDPLFRQAAEVCIQNQLGSTSLLQRRMSIGYGRAARIIDQPELAGILGPANGSKPRMCWWASRSWMRSAGQNSGGRAVIGHCAQHPGYVLRRRGARLPGMQSGVRSDPADWSDERHRLGVAAEERAIGYLQSRGWTVVAHRFRAGRVEIDLIARRGPLVAFIEVKSRRGDGFGSPLEAVTGAKRREVVKAARLGDRCGRPAISIGSIASPYRITS
jgi:hypothetical protein